MRVDDLSAKDRLDLSIKLSEIWERATDRATVIGLAIIALKLFSVTPVQECFFGLNVGAANREVLVGALGWALLFMLWRAGRYMMLSSVVYPLSNLIMEAPEDRPESEAFKGLMKFWAFVVGAPAILTQLFTLVVAIVISAKEMWQLVKVLVSAVWS